MNTLTLGDLFLDSFGVGLKARIYQVCRIAVLKRVRRRIFRLAGKVVPAVLRMRLIDVSSVPLRLGAAELDLLQCFGVSKRHIADVSDFVSYGNGL